MPIVSQQSASLKLRMFASWHPPYQSHVPSILPLVHLYISLRRNHANFRNSEPPKWLFPKIGTLHVRWILSHHAFGEPWMRWSMPWCVARVRKCLLFSRPQHFSLLRCLFGDILNDMDSDGIAKPYYTRAPLWRRLCSIDTVFNARSWLGTEQRLSVWIV